MGLATGAGGPLPLSTGGRLGGGPPLAFGGDREGVLGGLTDGLAFFSFPPSPLSFARPFRDRLLSLRVLDLRLLDRSRRLRLLLRFRDLGLDDVVSALGFAALDELECFPSSSSTTPSISLTPALFEGGLVLVSSSFKSTALSLGSTDLP